jgi:HK97 family phage major capsid protein
MSTQSDSMVARLEGELAERNAFIQGTIASAQDREGDLTANEKELVVHARSRVSEINEQLDLLHETHEVSHRARERAMQVQNEIVRMRKEVDTGPVEYRSAGAYLLDQYRSSIGDKAAGERLDVFTRAAAHQKTSDNLGLVPDPITGDLLNFIDSSRPIVNLLGPRAMPSATWHRPKVTQHTSIGKQGSAGAAADEKSELVSQKMTITRIDGNAVTYGGYVNVSRQNIDFSSPSAMDAIVNDLAAQYAIQTEAAVGAALVASANTIEVAGTGAAAFSSANLTAALWTAAANIYAATKGQGRIFVAVPPDQLGNWGASFAPVNPQNAQSEGFSAGNFSQGIMGYVSGIPILVSTGITAGTVGIVASSAAVEVYEQRVGTLQVAEPSVLGVQVAYAGYFTPMTVETGGVQRLINLA